MALLLRLSCLLGAAALVGCASIDRTSPASLRWWCIAMDGSDRLIGGRHPVHGGYEPAMTVDIDRAWESAPADSLAGAHPGASEPPEYRSATHLTPGEVFDYRTPEYGGDVQVIHTGPQRGQLADWVLQAADRDRAGGARVYIVSTVDDDTALAIYGTRGWPTEVIQLGRVELSKTSVDPSGKATP